MSGHSKWNNIKNKKAKGDAERSKIFTKIGREITVAVKSGGTDPNTNSKLYDAIQKAKDNNVPNENVMRSIKKASGEGSEVVYTENMYEGYGIGGVAVLVETLTDNKNRTAGDVRHLFDKFGGSMGTSNCVSFMFDRKGVIVVDGEDANEDDLMEVAIENGGDDLVNDEDVFEIYTDIANLSPLRKAIEAKGFKVLSAEREWIPQSTTVLSEEQKKRFNMMIEAMENNDDIQNIFHNAENVDEEE